MLNILLLCSLTRECHNELRDYALISIVIEFILVDKVLQVIHIATGQHADDGTADEEGVSSNNN